MIEYILRVAATPVPRVDSMPAWLSLRISSFATIAGTHWHRPTRGTHLTADSRHCCYSSLNRRSRLHLWHIACAHPRNFPTSTSRPHIEHRYSVDPSGRSLRTIPVELGLGPWSVRVATIGALIG